MLFLPIVWRGVMWHGARVKVFSHLGRNSIIDSNKYKHSCPVAWRDEEWRLVAYVWNGLPLLAGPTLIIYSSLLCIHKTLWNLISVSTRIMYYRLGATMIFISFNQNLNEWLQTARIVTPTLLRKLFTKVPNLGLRYLQIKHHLSTINCQLLVRRV